jgi:hypothetical protein
MTDRQKAAAVIAGLFAVLLVLPTMLYVQQHRTAMAVPAVAAVAHLGAAPVPAASSRAAFCRSRCSVAMARVDAGDDVLRSCLLRCDEQ